MTSWPGTMDLGVVHALAFLECRLGEGPVNETSMQIVYTGDFGAIEIASVRDPGVRDQARVLLSERALFDVDLPMQSGGIEIGITYALADEHDNSFIANETRTYGQSWVLFAVASGSGQVTAE